MHRNKEHHSKISSARPDSGSVMVMPSARAVFKLMYISTLVTCWMGRSAGFTPLRIRRRERPCRRAAAEERDELAPPNVCSRNPSIERYHAIVGNAALGVTENLGGKSMLCREIALVSLAAKVAAVPGER